MKSFQLGYFDYKMNLLFAINDLPEADIRGLTYLPDYISVDQEQVLITHIDQQRWITVLKRRVQHYGYRYDYKARAVTSDSHLGPLPDWLQPVAQKLYDDGTFPAVPDQAIVNEYLPGQGISAHIDCVPCFADTIASLSLSSPAIMQFTNPQYGEKKEILLQERSLIVLSGEARYEWTHSIPARKADIVNGLKINRNRRVSLTFRNIIS